MKQIRKRLTYANVMSSIAVFLVVGGATAFAAGHLGKNTVGTKQLKKNAVTAAKIKKNSVTGAKVNLATFGTVPSATNASLAQNATNATNAKNATTVNGQSQTKIFKTLQPGQSETVAAVAGFTIAATCEPSYVEVTATSPSSPGSVLSAEIDGSPAGPEFEYESSKSGSSSKITLSGGNSYGESTFSGALSNGTVVSGDVGYDYETFDGEEPERCVVFGEVASG